MCRVCCSRCRADFCCNITIPRREFLNSSVSVLLLLTQQVLERKHIYTGCYAQWRISYKVGPGARARTGDLVHIFLQVIRGVAMKLPE